MPAGLGLEDKVVSEYCWVCGAWTSVVHGEMPGGCSLYTGVEHRHEVRTET